MIHKYWAQATDATGAAVRIVLFDYKWKGTKLEGVNPGDRAELRERVQGGEKLVGQGTVPVP